MLLGIDIGTTNIKSCAYDERGRQLAFARRPTPTRRLSGGGAEYDAREIEQAAFETTREVIEKTGSPEAIGVASMAESGFLIGADGEPLTPAIAWFDGRTAPQAARWEERIPAKELFRRTGLRAEPLYTATKLEWLRENMPQSWKDARLWLGMSEYLAFRMTGKAGTEASLAGRTLLFDVGRGRWDEELCSLAGVHPGLLPPIYPAGATVGMLTKAAADRISASEGTPVAVCGHDHICGAFGAGATAPGEIADSIGTAEACLLTVEEPPLDEAGYALELPVGCHVLPDTHYVAATLAYSGGMIGWLKELLGDSDEDLDRWTREAESLAPGEGGVCVPVPDGGNGVTFSGLRVGEARPAHLLRAALEGLTLEVHAALKPALRAVEIIPVKITMTGGGSRNRLWNQLKADVSDLPVQAVPDMECVARGAAMLAGIGTGIFPNAESVPAPDPAPAVIEPAGNHAAYERLYSEVYRPLREHLRRAGRFSG